MVDATEAKPIATTITGATSPAENTGELALATAIENATRETIAEHTIANPPKRKPGRPKQIAVASPVSNTMAANQNAPMAGTSQAGQAVPNTYFDEENFKKILIAACQSIDSIGLAFVKIAARKAKCDKETEREAIETARMGDITKDMITTGGLACLRKHSVQSQYLPEMVLGFGVLMHVGGLFGCILTLTQTSATKQLKNEKQPLS